MAGGPDEPSGPGGPRVPGDDDGGLSDRERRGDVATKTRQKIARPPRFKVILFNDDYTPMEFVVSVLENVFKKGPSEATQIMLHVHRNGAGIAGVYVLEVAETKVVSTHRLAEKRGYPLRAGVEAE